MTDRCRVGLTRYIICTRACFIIELETVKFDEFMFLKLIALQ